jgi:NAD(P)-dependent dehydrogenase (short-subunit alcohol dehydrogenase family)
VNEVSPGPTRTEGAAPFGEGLDQLASLGLLKRVASPEEIAATVVFLAMDDAAYVQGASLSVDGGFLAA